MDFEDKIRFREQMKLRLKQFVLDLILLCNKLPKTDESRIFKRQVLRSGSLVYANYRAACRARSKAEFFSKVSIVVEEADETEMWLEIIKESGIHNGIEIINLHEESLELLKIMATARKNTK